MCTQETVQITKFYLRESSAVAQQELRDLKVRPVETDSKRKCIQKLLQVPSMYRETG